MSTFVNNNITQTSVSTGILGTASGRTIFTNNVLPGNLVSIYAIVNTTATAGSRLFVYNIKDSSGNIVWQSSAPSTTPASTAQKLLGGSSINSQNVAGLFITSFTVPSFVPPNGTVSMQDLNNIDVNDNISIGQIVVQY
jgi:hypothetical protein